MQVTTIHQKVQVKNLLATIQHPQEGYKVVYISGGSCGTTPQDQEFLKSEILDVMRPNQWVRVTLENTSEAEAWEKHCNEVDKQKREEKQRLEKLFKPTMFYSVNNNNGLTVNTYHYAIDTVNKIAMMSWGSVKNITSLTDQELREHIAIYNQINNK